MSSIRCPHHPACPGCPLLELDADSQLEQKEGLVRAAFAGYPELESAAVAPIVAASQVTDYRVRAKLVAEAGKLGLYRAGSHEVLDLPECRVLAPALRDTAQALRGWLPGEVSAVDLRQADEGVLVTLVARRGASKRELTELGRDVAERVPAVAGVALAFRDPDSPQLLGDEPEVVHGAAELPHHFDPEAPFHYAAHGAFTQAHPGQAARLHRKVADLLSQRLGGLAGKRVLELHAGSGLLGLRLAQAGAMPTLVEAFAPAVARAEQAARQQHLALRAVAEEAVAYCEAAVRKRERYEAVLVNPPRRGLEARLRAAITQLEPATLLYVSCAPATFARDAAHFARLGYALRGVTPFDLIPLSDAVEVVGEFVPDTAPPPRVLHEDGDLIAVERQGLEPARALLERVRALPGAGAATPLLGGDPDASGVELFARSPACAARLSALLTLAERRYVALVKGVTHNKGTLPGGGGAGRTGARTRYTRKGVVSGHSLISARPEPGQPDEVRRHLKSIGHPVIGDARFGDRASNGYFWHRHGLDRPFLHLELVRLDFGSGPLELRAELPGDLSAVLESARGH